MRATVGPLSPAVYWRRRAVVLSAVLLGVIVLFMSCSGGDKPDPTKTAATQGPGLPAPGAADSSADPTPTPSSSFEETGPVVGPALPDPAELLSQQPTDDVLPPPASSTAPVAGAGTACADSEIALTAVPSDTSPQRGAPTNLTLKIKNVGVRTCTRDLGASAQELYIDQGGQKFWSSDLCSTTKGSQIETLAAGAERVYEVTWNGRQSNQCTSNVASGPIPPNGAYQLRGRLDSVLSPAVVLTLVG